MIFILIVVELKKYIAEGGYIRIFEVRTYSVHRKFYGLF
jgi:hypothetical protein